MKAIHHSGYRPDIDGLRSIAILTVLLFHAGYEWASGGYIGVDVFFVISGYLITNNITQSFLKGSFTFKGFYLRRVRRLFPALFFTLGISFLVGLWVLSPRDMERLGQSTLYSVVSVSNIFFWSESGYFNEASILKPLLHTWSLSVEEQYYMVWPAVLIFLLSFRRRAVVFSFLVGVAILSFYMAAINVQDSPDKVFFLSHFRVFEFAFGALGVWLFTYQPKNKLVLEPILLTGLAMILWATVNYTEATPFPGLYALLPCFGSALVIYAGRARFFGVLLRNKLAVGIGLISYSLYLVHWPLIVYYQYWKGTPINDIERVMLLLGSVLLGFLMWKFVETPFRKPKEGEVYDSVQFWAPVSALVLMFFAANAWGNNGWPSRLPNNFHMTNEQRESERAKYWAEPRDIERGENYPDIVIMGNSHAIDLFHSLTQNGADFNSTFLPTSPQCFNFGSPIAEEYAQKCEDTKDKNYSSSAWESADAVYLHDNWFRLDLDDLSQKLKEIRSLTAAPIYVFGPKMWFTRWVPDTVKSHMSIQELNNYSRKFQRNDRSLINDKLRQYFAMAEFKSLKTYYIDMLKTQCGESTTVCDIVAEDGEFLYFDSHHFTKLGAFKFGQKLKNKHPELFDGFLDSFANGTGIKEDFSGKNQARAAKVLMPTKPDPPTPLSPSGVVNTITPTFTWTASSKATNYGLFISVSGEREQYVEYAPEDAGCSSMTGNCTITSTITLADGDSIYWKVSAKNVIGRSASQALTSKIIL